MISPRRFALKMLLEIYTGMKDTDDIDTSGNPAIEQNV